MNKELAREIFKLSIDAQRIENRKYEIKKQIRGEDSVIFPSWDEVSTMAMKYLMEETEPSKASIYPGDFA